MFMYSLEVSFIALAVLRSVGKLLAQVVAAADHVDGHIIDSLVVPPAWKVTLSVPLSSTLCIAEVSRHMLELPR
jgi:hypothetical protein